jgi:hypothetical protein
VGRFTLLSERGFAGINQASPQFRVKHIAIAYILLAVTGLIVLRATVDELEFLGVGWILALAVLPLLPWLLPRFGSFLREISPYVQSLKLGALQLDFRALRREPIAVPSSGTFRLRCR